MGKFTHYLITRFNVKPEGLGPEQINPDSRTPDWETNRISLFQQFCAPMVNAQSTKGFIWLLCCDIHSSPGLVNTIRKSIVSSLHYDVLLVRDYRDMMEQLQSRCMQSDSPYVISTRLDNDDGIAIDYIKNVQDHFEATHNTIINQLGGVHYDTDKGVFTRHRYSLRNSFMSLIEEKAKGIQTVLSFKHLTPGADKKMINVPVKFAFWMTLHGNNAAQRINLGWPIPVNSALPYYAVDPGHVSVSWPNTVCYTLRWFPRALKRKVGYLLRSRVQRLFHSSKHSINQASV